MSARNQLIEIESCCDVLLQRSCLLQNALGEEILDLRLVADDLVIRGLDQLLAAITKLLTNGLLHSGIFQPNTW